MTIHKTDHVLCVVELAKSNIGFPKTAKEDEELSVEKLPN